MVFTLTNKMTNKQWHGGKGSQRRNADDKAYADNWDKIFGKSSHISKDTTRGGTEPSKDKNKDDKEI